MNTAKQNGRASRARVMGTGLALGALVMLASGCATGQFGAPGDRLERAGDEIMAAGQMFHTGAPVVLWTDYKSYDAYRAHCRFKPDQELPSKPVSDSPVRFGSWRRGLPEEVADEVRADGWDLATLQQYVTQFVMHYDVCGTSARCFDVLQDRRGLSVHFMLDLDGTIYQTLDLKERAWHAGTANNQSIGIEIANMGAYPDPNALNKWYALDANGEPYISYLSTTNRLGYIDPNFVAYPSRPELFSGSINGSMRYQYDLTDAQYDSLIKLVATVCQVLPEITCDYPKDENGQLITDAMSREELAEYQGILGHYHVTRGKSDPGPAFDWDRVIKGARKLMH